MSDNIAEQFSAVLTDLNRLTYDNEDPMRYSKRKARMIGLQLLSEAVSRARELVELNQNIEMNYKDSKVTP